jgi:hypothetical protein
MSAPILLGDFTTKLSVWMKKLFDLYTHV